VNSRKGSANHRQPESGWRLATMAKIVPLALKAATLPEVDQDFGSFLPFKVYRAQASLLSALSKQVQADTPCRKLHSSFHPCQGTTLHQWAAGAPDPALARATGSLGSPVSPEAET
jgi:hypothetical protein